MIPVADFVRRSTTPYVNWTLLAINVAVFVYMLALSTEATAAGDVLNKVDQFITDYGFMPVCVSDQLGWTDASPSVIASVCPSGDERVFTQVFTSMFVHAGWAHIIGNMLFLWIFGDNVEDRMGHLRYLLFYFICGIAAALTQTFVSPDLAVPNVGASGAIAGVLGAYLILYPKAWVQVVIIPLFFLPFLVPAALLIGFWFVTQLFSGLAEMGNTTAGSGVAFWAHIGGFIAGAVLVWIFKRRLPRRRFAEV